MSVMCDIFNMPPPCHPNAWKNHATVTMSQTLQRLL
jgi:hypothetical protein